MYVTNHDIHYLKALSVWFHSFNFLSWPAIGSASGLKTDYYINTGRLSIEAHYGS